MIPPDVIVRLPEYIYNQFICQLIEKHSGFNESYNQTFLHDRQSTFTTNLFAG